MPVCACAATGAPSATPSAARARILFRMGNSFDMILAGANGATGCQCCDARDVPENALPHSRHFWAVFAKPGTRATPSASLPAEPGPL
jgi:hypothetical protein